MIAVLSFEQPQLSRNKMMISILKSSVVMKMKKEFPDTICAFVALTAESSDSLQDVLSESGITGYLNKQVSQIVISFMRIVVIEVF